MKNSKNFIIWLITGIVFCAGIVMIGVGSSFLVENKPAPPICETSSCDPPTSCEEENCGGTGGSFDVEFDDAHLRTRYARTNDPTTLLWVHMGQAPSGDGNLGHPRLVSTCSDPTPVCAEVTYTLENSNPTLSLTVKEIVDSPDVTCFETTWESSSDDVAPTDCVQMSDHWFGGAEMFYQDWPINSWKKHMSFYLSGDMFSDPQQYGSVLERYWLSSQGVALWVPQTIPLHVSIEKQQICLKGSYESPYYVRNSNHAHNWLQYTACFGKTPQIAHEFMFTKYFFSRPMSLPDTRMMESPIWSTWARYKVNINESVVLTYANEILSHGFSNSQLEIDDGYEVFYGDHSFDPEKFPNASRMIETLHNKGFRVTTWVTPFINPRSENYKSFDENRYFVINGKTNKSGKVPWWNGLGSSIDFTNFEACDWYAKSLENVKSTFGVDSFKFDAGEINYITVIPEFQTDSEMQNLGTYTQKYGECAFSRFGTQIELRAAWNCQRLPVFVRMMDKDSNWGRAKGLKTLIPTALTFSILGYPYILPDMIGGNAYEDGFHGTPLPEKELFIRWLELTAFLPAMQFSYVPWQYDNETVEIAKKFVSLHETVVFDELRKVSLDYVNYKTGMGPIRPIWWITFDDSRAFMVDDEFLVGDRYLVAPIVENSTRSRDIYLPGPLWRDGTQNIIWEDKLNKRGPILGGTTVYNYPIELDEISWWELKLY